MSKDGGGFGTRGLYILLGFLCVVIVGLSISVFMIINNNNAKQDIIIDDDSVDIVTRFVNRKPIDEDYMRDINLAVSSLDSIQDGINLFEAVISANIDNDNDVLKLRISYSLFLSRNDLFGDGLNQLDISNQLNLDVLQKIKLYIAYRDYYLLMGDEDNIKKYDSEITRLMEESGISEDTEF